MKKLALLMFVLLVLGCDTEKPAVKEPEPVVEEPPPIVVEDEPLLPQPEMIAEGTVKHGEVNVNRKLLNLSGFRFVFKEPIYTHSVSLYDKKRGKRLDWNSPHAHWWIETQTVVIERMDPNSLLERNTDYEITIYTRNFDCEVSKTVIQFRTGSQRSTVEEPEPVMPERPPIVPSGEHFRIDIQPPQIMFGDVRDGANDIDPEPLNANGIHFIFDRDIRKYEIDLQFHEGESLGWLPRGLVEGENIGDKIQIIPAEGAPLLKFDTVYVIDIFVQDFECLPQDFRITFLTKPQL